MEARIARLESDVGHIQSDIADIKTDIREFRNLDIRELRTGISDISDDISRSKVWAFGLYIALAAGMLYVMAKGFGWLD